jgi:hypothetical protein
MNLEQLKIDINNDRKIESLRKLAFRTKDQEVLKVLVNHKDEVVRSLIALNKNSSAEILDKISKGTLRIKLNIISNKNVSAKTIKRLSKLKSVKIKREIERYISFSF